MEELPFLISGSSVYSDALKFNRFNRVVWGGNPVCNPVTNTVTN
jgi:hypothetical protein